MYLCFITKHISFFVWVSCAAFFPLRVPSLTSPSASPSNYLTFPIHPLALQSRKLWLRNFRSTLERWAKKKRVFWWYFTPPQAPRHAVNLHINTVYWIIFFRNVHLLFLYFCMSNENFSYFKLLSSRLLLVWALRMGEIFADALLMGELRVEVD